MEWNLIELDNDCRRSNKRNERIERFRCFEVDETRRNNHEFGDLCFICI